MKQQLQKPQKKNTSYKLINIVSKVLLPELSIQDNNNTCNHDYMWQADGRVMIIVNLAAVDHNKRNKRKVKQFLLCIKQLSLQCITLMYRFVQQFMESLDPVVFDTYVDIFGTWLEVCCLLFLQGKYIVVCTCVISWKHFVF